MRITQWMIILAAPFAIACENGDPVLTEDCPNDGHCELDCPGEDADCDYCTDDIPDRCVTGCAGIDVDCQCSNDSCPGQCFSDVCFIQGAISYADEVLTYDNTHSGNPPPPVPGETVAGLHAPDDLSITLGQGGLLELLFFDNILTNSGDNFKDLFVFEIGPDVEASFIWVRALDTTASELIKAGFIPEGEWFAIGTIGGSTRQIDIDDTFPGFGPGALHFDAVRILDDKDQGDSGWDTPGADIDAVGAIATIEREPSS